MNTYGSAPSSTLPPPVEPPHPALLTPLDPPIPNHDLTIHTCRQKDIRRQLRQARRWVPDVRDLPHPVLLRERRLSVDGRGGKGECGTKERGCEVVVYVSVGVRFAVGIGFAPLRVVNCHRDRCRFRRRGRERERSRFGGGRYRASS